MPRCGTQKSTGFGMCTFNISALLKAATVDAIHSVALHMSSSQGDGMTVLDESASLTVSGSRAEFASFGGASAAGF